MEGGGGWDTRLAAAKCSRGSAAALQLLERGGFFLAKVGQCKLPLPVGHVSERETILLRWGEKSAALWGPQTHTHTHTNRNRAKEAGEWEWERASQ